MSKRRHGPLTQEMKDCDHVFEDVTEERIRLIEEGELPEWAKILIAKEDRRWKDKPSDVYKSSKYLKCSECGLLRIVPKEAM